MKPILHYLSETEVLRIHEAALELLINPGMKLPCDEVLQLLSDAGARVEGDVAKIPGDLVERALETVPKKDGFVLYGREPEFDINFNRDVPAIVSMTEATQIIDPISGDRRPASNSDLARLTQFVNHLENVLINSALVTPQDVPGDLADWYSWATSIKNTAKHILGAGPGAESVKDVIRMASIAVGGEDNFRKRPFISFSALTRPPFEVDPLTLSALLEVSRWKVPTIISSGPILGITGPVTIAGMTAQAHAETLGLLVISQLARPGAPVIYTSFARSMDMRTGAVSMSSPEFTILKACVGQMGRHFGLPVSMPGMLRDAKTLDAQAGYETGMTGSVAALAADLVIAMQFDMDIHVDYKDLVFCNEVMGAFRRLARDLVISDETLGLDVIRNVGHGGTFLSHDHTFRNFKEEIWQPSILERRMWAKWHRDGARSISSIAENAANEILSRPPRHLLPEKAQAEIDFILVEISSARGQTTSSAVRR